MTGDIPLSRYMHGFTALNGYLFLFGGFYSGGIHSILGEAGAAVLLLLCCCGLRGAAPERLPAIPFGNREVHRRPFELRRREFDVEGAAAVGRLPCGAGLFRP